MANHEPDRTAAPDVSPPNRSGPARTRSCGIWLLALIVALLAMPLPAAAAVVESFVQINAVQSGSDGGFLAIGVIENDVDGVTASAVLRLAPDGRILGGPVIVPAPDGYSYAYLTGLERLPRGGFIAVGWVRRTASDPDTDPWIVRIDEAGRLDWSEVLSGALDMRLYAVRLLADGTLLAVGRSQVSQSQSDPCEGLFVSFDQEGTGVETHTIPRGSGTLRSAFHDLAELPDGGVVFAGWSTANDGTDDVWLVRVDREFEVLANETVPLEGQDLAWSVAADGDDIVVTGTMPQAGTAFVAIFDTELRQRQRVAVPGASDLRAGHAFPGGGPTLLAGSADPEAVAQAYVARSSGAQLAVEPHPTAPRGGSHSAYLSVAPGPLGGLALVGRAAVGPDAPSRGLVEVVTGMDFCELSRADTAAIGEALSRSAGDVNRLACASSAAPTEIPLGPLDPDTGLLVEPLIGDIDVVLRRGGTVVDASFNRMHAPELVEIPGDGGDLELVVSTESAYASFRITRTSLEEPEPDADLLADSSEEIVALLPLLLDRLGYDRNYPDQADERTLRILQLETGVPATGRPDFDDAALLGRAARMIEPAAIAAAEIGREMASRQAGLAMQDTDVEPDDDAANGGEDEEADATDVETEGLVSFAGGLKGGKLYGSGRFGYGSRFAGLWRQVVYEPYYVPLLGVLTIPDVCKVALENVSEGGSSNWSPHDLRPALIVVRDSAGVAFAGYSDHAKGVNASNRVLMCFGVG